MRFILEKGEKEPRGWNHPPSRTLPSRAIDHAYSKITVVRNLPGSEKNFLRQAGNPVTATVCSTVVSWRTEIGNIVTWVDVPKSQRQENWERFDACKLTKEECDIDGRIDSWTIVIKPLHEGGPLDF